MKKLTNEDTVKSDNGLHIARINALLDLGFNVTEIAGIMGTFEFVIQKRIEEANE